MFGKNLMFSATAYFGAAGNLEPAPEKSSLISQTRQGWMVVDEMTIRRRDLDRRVNGRMRALLVLRTGMRNVASDSTICMSRNSW